jgi:hypothetical protein
MSIRCVMTRTHALVRPHKICHLYQEHMEDRVLNDTPLYCPVCSKQFDDGWYPPAKQKLYHHMSRGREHRRVRNEMKGGDTIVQNIKIYFYQNFLGFWETTHKLKLSQA